jgi:rod shape-determining protein MreB
MSLHAAGNAMDESIRDYVRSNYCLQIGEYTAEALKRELGALNDEDIPSDER